jgi:divalent metal cation (Fe/Co/Zn/Cd) transporter
VTVPKKPADGYERSALKRGRRLEAATLSWNVVGVAILVYAAFVARSVALAGFGLDSVIEIGASTVVLWELAEVAHTRQRTALRLIGSSFVALAVYLGVQSTVVLLVGFRPHHSPLGIVWTAMTSVAMFTLASGKKRVGTLLANPVIMTEARVTLIDAILASAVLVGLAANAVLGWWWADPATGYLILYYALREARGSFKS